MKIAIASEFRSYLCKIIKGGYWMNETLVDEILKRVLEAVNRYEDSLEGKAGKWKEKVLLLNEREESPFYELLVKAGGSEQYTVDCALARNFDVNPCEYKAVVLQQLSIQTLGKLSSGIYDSPFLLLASRIILSGKKLYVPEGGVELFTYRDSAPKAYYKMLEDKLNLLLESGVVITQEQQLLKLLQNEILAEEKQKPINLIKDNSEKDNSESSESKGTSIDKKIITEKDLIKVYEQRVKKICIPSNSILSDMAKEYAKDKKIEIQRSEAVSGTARRAR
jgi:ethanolamine utilization protein